MKMSNTITFFLALFLLCAFASHLRSATAEIVFDTDGDPVRNGGFYHVLPVFKGKGGGIDRTKTGTETCPLTVVQSRFEVSKGLPVVISSPIRLQYIHEHLILEIQFLFSPSCTRPEWKLVQGLPEGLAVKQIGYNDTVPGWFQIHRVSQEFYDYKFLFISADGTSTWDLGIYIDSDQNRRLVATDSDPLLVQFQKLESSTA